MEQSCTLPPSAFTRFAELRSAATGFLTDEDRARMPHVVRLTSLTRAALGDGRFERVFALCKHAAAQLAPRDYWAETVVEDNTRTGYIFGFADKLAALRFALCHEAAMRGRPSPLAGRGAAQ
jgi:hypothetical protein